MLPLVVGLAKKAYKKAGPGTKLGSALASSAEKIWDESGASKIKPLDWAVKTGFKIHREKSEKLKAEKEKKAAAAEKPANEVAKENTLRNEVANEKAKAASSTTVSTLDKIAANTHKTNELLKAQIADQKETQKKPESTGILGKIGSLVSSLVSSVGGSGLGGLAAGAAGGLLSKAGGLVARGGSAIANIGSKAISGLGSLAGLGRAGIMTTGGVVAGAGGIAAGADAAKDAIAKKAAGTVATEGAEKIGAKTIGKSLLKKIPLIGLLAGLGFGANRALGGDFTGAAMEVASGAASTVPGLGTAASLGIDAALAAKDMGAFESNPEVKAQQAAQMNNSSSGDVASLFKRQTDIMNAMLTMMSTENAGIYVKLAKDPLSSPNPTLKAASQSSALSKPDMTPVDDPNLKNYSVLKQPGQQSAFYKPRETSSSFSRVPASVETKPTKSVNDLLVSQTQAAIDKGVKYGFGSKDVESGAIDCSGWVASINKGVLDTMNKTVGAVDNSKAANKLFEGGAAGIVKNMSDVTGKIYGNSELTPDTVKEGMVIGESSGKASWAKDRFNQIDHITQIVRDPKTGQLMVSQSSGGKGVNLMPVDKYLEQKNAKGTKLYGVDAQDALNRVTAGTYKSKAAMLENQATSSKASILSEANQDARDRQASQTPAAPIIIQQAAQKDTNNNSAGDAGAQSPMVVRNNDSSVRRLTDAMMAVSMP